jgi:hypothetical protein
MLTHPLISIGLITTAIILALNAKQLHSSLAQGDHCPNPDLTIENLTRTISKNLPVGDRRITSNQIMELREAASCTGFVLERISSSDDGDLVIEFGFNTDQMLTDRSGQKVQMNNVPNSSNFIGILKVLETIGNTDYNFVTQPFIATDISTGFEVKYPSTIMTGIRFTVKPQLTQISKLNNSF